MGASLAISASAYEPAILKTTAEGKTESSKPPTAVLHSLRAVPSSSSIPSLPG